MRRLLAVAALAVAGTAGSAAAPKPSPMTLAWAPGDQIAVGVYRGRTSRGGIYLADQSGQGLRRLTDKGGGDSALDWSPDGRTLAFDLDFRLYVVRADGSGLRSLGKGFLPRWSPDGRRLAFFRNSGLFVMNVDGNGSHRVLKLRYVTEAGPAAWSPDGKRLAYVACSAPFLSRPCEHQYGFDVYAIGTNGKGKRRITSRIGFPQCPAWSRAGRIAFTTQDNTVAIVQPGGAIRTFRMFGCAVWAPGGHRLAAGGRRGPLLINADGSGRRQLAARPDLNESYQSFAWSPDGRRIAFVAVGRGQKHPHRLYVIAADGTGLRRLDP